MKTSKCLVIAAAFLLLLPVLAQAKTKDNDKTEHNVKLYETVQVGSTQLKPGNYKVEWQGTGNSVPITFMQEGKTVLSTTGTVIEQNKPAQADEVMTRKTASNQQKLEELVFGHHKEALRFTPATSGT